MGKTTYFKSEEWYFGLFKMNCYVSYSLIHAIWACKIVSQIQLIINSWNWGVWVQAFQTFSNPWIFFGLCFVENTVAKSCLLWVSLLCVFLFIVNERRRRRRGTSFGLWGREREERYFCLWRVASPLLLVLCMGECWRWVDKVLVRYEGSIVHV